MTDDGDVILTEPDNMQVEQKPLIASEDSIMLPPEENMTDVISTRNIVLKRKQPDISIGEIKKIKAKTDISIKHPIFRKMEKQKKAGKRLAKATTSGKPLEIKKKTIFQELKVRMNFLQLKVRVVFLRLCCRLQDH